MIDINNNGVITAEQAREISCKGRWAMLDKLIRERAEQNMKQLPLNNTGFGRLNNLDKKMLENNGFRICEGDSGKNGKFDIIYW